MFAVIGREIIIFFNECGKAFNMLRSCMFWLFKAPFEWAQAMQQSVTIGINSLTVTTLTSIFTGMVLALQGGNTISNILSEPMFVGTLVSFSLIRELGPVLTAVVVVGRAGAAVTAEIGTMQVTEQIDALYTLGTNPVRQLVLPRMFAFMLTVPILTLFANFSGIFGGYLVAVHGLGVPDVTYLEDITNYMNTLDFMHGFIKSIFFAFMVGTVCCYKGLDTKGGAEGVGRSTTIAVVTSMVLILVLDYFLTAILTAFGI
ncbi:ABC transporter related [Elusimicrobium minutum Pei191]|uniref:ABC transporter related n=1 Tax=Elusimicrobium minutum (strain Pei191) TaxID=445932 RepID=B2KBY2_ELUMP|nr:ABC transporter permease [Elusimicrobium minutum]ACC97886.1 ABC transporter related [Elusimicrobium minutum Pei191]